MYIAGDHKGKAYIIKISTELFFQIRNSAEWGNICKAYDITANIFTVHSRVGKLIVRNTSENDVSYTFGKGMFLFQKWKTSTTFQIKNEI